MLCCCCHYHCCCFFYFSFPLLILEISLFTLFWIHPGYFITIIFINQQSTTILYYYYIHQSIINHQPLSFYSPCSGYFSTIAIANITITILFINHLSSLNTQQSTTIIIIIIIIIPIIILFITLLATLLA